MPQLPPLRKIALASLLEHVTKVSVVDADMKTKVEKRYLPLLPVQVEGYEFDVLTKAQVDGYAERVKDVLWKVFNGNKEKEEEFLQMLDPEDNGFFTLAELCYALGHVLLTSYK